MKGLTRKKLMQLASIHEPECISIYIPTNRYGRDVLEQKDALRLKNAIRDIKSGLKAFGLHRDAITEKVRPLITLMEDHAFWRNQGAGLAIFYSNAILEIFKLEFKPESVVYVNTSFYLKPLIVNFYNDFSFFILKLTADKVALFEVVNNVMRERNIRNLVPLVLQETVGYDFKQDYLQYRSIQKGNKTLKLHGYGEGKDDSDLEIQKYFRAVNKGILPLLKESNRPLVISGLDYLCAMYTKINSYKGLYEKQLILSSSEANRGALKKRAQELIAPLKREHVEQKTENFKAKAYTSKTSSDMKTILKAILNKKVATLFLQKNKEHWGRFNPETNDLIFEKNHNPPNVALSNLASVHMFLQGRTVYELEKEAMPDPNSDWNAILYN